MIKYKEDEFSINFEGEEYYVNYSGSWTSEHGRWVENYCSYNVYNSDGAEVEDKKVLAESERSLHLQLWSVL